jgi:1-deoxy-D-xylulose-5-phosphate reductoisomerase
MQHLQRKVCVLGSTGSVGVNTLEVIRQHSSRFKVVGLSCGERVELLLPQIQEFKPLFVSVGSESARKTLQRILVAEGIGGVEIFVGDYGHEELVAACRPHVLMASMLGTFGLRATLKAIELQTEVIGIANKEVLVMAGPFIQKALEKSRSKIVPVDSEHSAVFQALMGNSIDRLRRIILTASGGPFRKLPREEFAKIRKEQALKHPNWVMGAKITIDSATMMNKGLEYIEAIRLFHVRPDQVEIVVHPQSIIHSMVEYVDHSFIAQLGVSDMKVPIALALSYPDRIDVELPKELDLIALKSLDFEAPDEARFPCLRLAREAVAMGDEGPVILNAANEVAVQSFLADEIRFTEIPEQIEAALGRFQGSKFANLEELIALDAEVKASMQGMTKALEYSKIKA